MLLELALRREEREPWRLRAACRGMGTDLFFPVRRGRQPKAGRETPGLAVCERCPVRAECGALARSLFVDTRRGADSPVRFAISDLNGIWGGVEYRRGQAVRSVKRG